MVARAAYSSWSLRATRAGRSIRPQTARAWPPSPACDTPAPRSDSAVSAREIALSAPGGNCVNPVIWSLPVFDRHHVERRRHAPGASTSTDQAPFQRRHEFFGAHRRGNRGAHESSEQSARLCTAHPARLQSGAKPFPKDRGSTSRIVTCRPVRLTSRQLNAIARPTPAAQAWPTPMARSREALRPVAVATAQPDISGVRANGQPRWLGQLRSQRPLDRQLRLDGRSSSGAAPVITNADTPSASFTRRTTGRSRCG